MKTTAIKYDSNKDENPEPNFACLSGTWHFINEFCSKDSVYSKNAAVLLVLIAS
jgi:hypothetical protein